MSDDIRVTFVIPKNCKSENECSEEMQLAFVTCDQHRGGGLQPTWVKEVDIKQLSSLTKRDVFVLNEFAGEIFDKLKQTKCLLVGPRCLSCCITEGIPIPSRPVPVFTIAMRNLIVSASGFSKTQKENITRKVQLMGGIYTSNLTDDTTHLVSDTVLSDKYIKSVEKGIPIMSISWVEDVWETSLRLNITGSSPDFEKHKLPPFANLQVTTSGISKKDKKLIMKLVSDNGGIFSGVFETETTDIVVLNQDGVGSEKYKTAIEFGKACVLPAWVKDSARVGVALPLSKYKVTGASTSSPLTGHRLPDMSLNFSRITNARPPNNFVDETRCDISTLSGRMKLTQEKRRSADAIDKDLQSAFETFDMSAIKKAGPIFDGYCIWVSGPEGTWRERASAMVSRGGGVRYDGPHERVTHVVAGGKAAAAAATALLPTAPVISPAWLIDSVRAGKALDEVQYLIEQKPASPARTSVRRPKPEPASPMSKRNLQLLRRPLLLPPPEPEPEPVLEPPPDDIVNHYLSQNMPNEPEKEKTSEYESTAKSNSTKQDPEITEDCEDLTEEIEQIFSGMTIEIQGLDEEAICEIGAEVTAAGGTLLAAGSGGTHVLVPFDFDVDELITDTAEAVTEFWIKDCLSQQELVPIEYYHRPVKAPKSSPLTDVVASLSTYSGLERSFLDKLAKLLGATTQLRFCRRTTKSALASTHLLCPTPTGEKYLGAVKWGLPAVTADWLFKCAETGRRVHEGPFLVGDTKAPPMEEIREPEVVEQPEERAVEQNVSDKKNAMLPPADGTVAPRRSSIPSREQTPKAKISSEPDNDLSPASRYIAMARQGLLGDSQETPKRVGELRGDAKQDGEVRTPPLDDALSTPNLRGLSPTTRRRLQAVKRGEMPSDPIRTPVDPFEKQPETPDSAFGAALRPGSGRLSPEARKRLWKFVQDLPSKEPEPVKEKQTPLSEIRNRFLAQFNSGAPTPPSEHTVAAPRKLHLQDQVQTPPSKMPRMTLEHQSPRSPLPNHDESSSKSASSLNSGLPASVDVQLQQLSAALSRPSPVNRVRRGRDSIKTQPQPVLMGPESEPGPESQPNTVGWDDTTPQAASVSPVEEPEPPKIKRFMLSCNVENHEEIIAMIQRLGGEVSEGFETDPEATHLLCAAPVRSEKMLGSMAHGKWVLHPAYVVRSRANGAFLPEEEYEWGNEKATSLPTLGTADRVLAAATCRWRKRRALHQPGPFDGMVALLHVPSARKRLLQRLIEAGDGRALDLESPYDEQRESEDITVCFADLKRLPLSERDVAWLKAKRIPVCPPVLLSSYLTDEVRPNPKDHCLPDFRT